MEGTWKILNNVIKKNNGTCTSFPEIFRVNGTTISDKNGIADGFNNFFVNIGPKLADNIVPPSGDESFFYYMKAHVTDSMFLFTTDDLEIAKVVRECKPKKCTGYDGINMNIMKVSSNPFQNL